MENKIIVIGNGLAGLSAAITAVQNGQKVCVISCASPDRSQSVMAAGGINAALNTKSENDSVDNHFEDTMHAGCDIADTEAVRNMTENAPALIKWFENIGTVFSRDEEGNVDLRNFGGQKKKRTAYAKAGIGKQLICAMSQEFRRLKAEGNIETMEYCHFLEPIIENGRIYGCIIFDERTQEQKIVYGKAMIIASGGMSALYQETTGSIMSDGSVTAALFANGVELSNCEMIQFHPTTVRTQSKRMLISEAARGEGGRLLVMREGKPWYFMEEWYPEKGNLMPRDIVSKSIYKVCREMKLGNGGKDEVYLDLTHLPKEKCRESLKEIDDLCKTYLHIDITKEMIPVYPSVHYFMGGIDVNIRHQTNIAGLYAAGECCSQYHGANRLGGNSTLGAVYGGRIAGLYAANEMSPADEIIRGLKITDVNNNYCADQRTKSQVNTIMNDAMGIVRNQSDLEDAEAQCRMYLKQVVGKNRELVNLALAVVLSALKRKETRGAQIRSDYSDRNNKYIGLTRVKYSNECLEVSLDERGA